MSVVSDTEWRMVRQSLADARAENERLRAANTDLRLSNENLRLLLAQQARPLTDAEQIERYGRFID